MIKYSVVIPMYNNEGTIEKTIQSVINQTKYDLIDEIIVVNDGSTDKSLEIVNSLILEKNSKIKILNKTNGGASSARNVGIKNTRNEYIALLDADDVWLPNKLEIQNEILEKYTDIKVLGSNRIGEIIKYGTKITDSIYRISPFRYCIKNWPCTPSIIFRKSLFKNDLYFNESMTHAEEGIFFLEVASCFGLYYTIEPLVFCGDGKPTYGHSGLSKKLKKMHKGIKMMHEIASEKGYISFFQRKILDCYEDIKYLKRIFVSKNRRK